MRFLADMGISPRTVEKLRELGHEAVHLHELGLDCLSDAAILNRARQEGQIVLPHGLDFGELLAVSRARLPSVITFRLRDMRSDNINLHLAALLTQHRPSLEQGAIITMTEQRIRVRALPITR